MEMIRARCFFAFVIMVLVLCSGHSRAQQDFDKERYHRAVEFCRGSVWQPMTLSPDAQILCFNGTIVKGMDVSLARRLNEGGLFVVRSHGQSEISAIALSDLIRERRATVVVYDYCLSDCAAFLFIASHQTFVVKGALVAWNYRGSDDANRSTCISFRTLPDGGPKKLRFERCGDDSSDVPTYDADWAAQRRFFKERAVSPFFDEPPDSPHVRRIIGNRYAQTGEFHDTAWTIHPRYYSALFKTRIVYEAYPETQQEVDNLVSRLRLSIGVIHDP